MRNTIRQIVWNIADLSQGAFTAVASTDVCSSTAHGLTVGEVIEVASTTTLPAGLSAATTYYIISVPSANTFKVSATKGGTTVNITDTGTGTHTWYNQGSGSKILVEDFRNVNVVVDTDGGTDAALTVKFASSHEDIDDAPDFDIAQAYNNQYDYVEVVDLESGAAIDGDTGIAVAGADDHRHLAINTDNITWITAIISGRTEGECHVVISAGDNQ